jgi:rare lipoprotein A
MSKLSTAGRGVAAALGLAFAAGILLPAAPAGAAEATVTEKGVCQASYYGAPGEIPPGSRTANGDVFDPNAMTAAHNSYPFGTRVRVNYQGKTIEVRINDRGSFGGARCLDLTYGAFQKLANKDLGVINVNYRRL